MKIYLDFDGTVVEHRYPKIGEYNNGASEVIKKLQDANHEIILNTYRVDVGDNSLNEAIYYLNNSDNLKIKPIVKNTSSKLYPVEFDMEFFKAKEFIMIDDQCLGTPLRNVENSSFGLMVDWFELDKIFIKHKIY